MDNHPYQEEVGFAIEAVRTGALLAKRIQSEHGHERSIKRDRSPVTLADFAVQAHIARMLSETFSTDGLVAEEESAQLEDDRMLAQVTDTLRQLWPGLSRQDAKSWIERGNGEPSRRYWTLDPVDGTKGFLRGQQYVVALALVVEGQVVLGAIGCPNLNAEAQAELGGAGSIASAVRGHGASIQPLASDERRRLTTSNIQDPSGGRLLRSVEAGHTNLARMEQIQAQLSVSVEPVLMDSQAKYVVLASGRADLIFRLLSPERPDYRENIWDQAAGALLVEEAGGRVSDLDGRPLDFSTGKQLSGNRGVLASNRHLHEAALWALKETEPAA